MFDDVTVSRFWNKVDRRGPNDCWNWMAGKIKGYGSFRAAGFYLAHRFSYVLTKGEIPHKYVCDHLCRNSACVNPRHIEAVTNSRNTLRGVSGLRGGSLFANKESVCRNGHERNSENTLVRANGEKDCRVCHRERMRPLHKAYRMRKKLERMAFSEPEKTYAE